MRPAILFDILRSPTAENVTDMLKAPLACLSGTLGPIVVGMS
jgi:hypothetical protein